ncbi:cAMP response element binding [Homalodisca vitripennis]|nr:cAMP response element binding [Homalodisca vitripennis]
MCCLLEGKKPRPESSEVVVKDELLSAPESLVSSTRRCVTDIEDDFPPVVRLQRTGSRLRPDEPESLVSSTRRCVTDIEDDFPPVVRLQRTGSRLRPDEPESLVSSTRRCVTDIEDDFPPVVRLQRTGSRLRPDEPESLVSSTRRCVTDIEDDFPPVVRLQRTGSRPRPESPEVVVKDEPLSEPESPMSSCPPSPSPPPSPEPTARSFADFKYEHKLKSGQSLLKQPTAVLMTRSSLGHHVVMPSLSIKLESQSSGFTLPPTPPSSTSSDSEGNVSPSHPSSPVPAPARRLFLSPASHSPASTRQPIQTPLISSQPKGSTGVLMLTEEEKRTLLAEGYPIPTRLPLTKAEEKSLKKIRRKIKNKISAQESRRKKKEYMDALERKVELLSSENSEFRKKITNLEDTNCSLMSQLHKLQALVARTHPQPVMPVSRNGSLPQLSLDIVTVYSSIRVQLDNVTSSLCVQIIHEQYATDSLDYRGFESLQSVKFIPVGISLLGSVKEKVVTPPKSLTPAAYHIGCGSKTTNSVNQNINLTLVKATFPSVGSWREIVLSTRSRVLCVLHEIWATV